MMNLWQNQAACKDMDPDIFVPDSFKPAALEQALEACETCPVRRECAKFGEWDGMGSPSKSRRNHAVGVWGGVYYLPNRLGTLTLSQLRAIKNRRR